MVTHIYILKRSKMVFFFVFFFVFFCKKKNGATGIQFGMQIKLDYANNSVTRGIL